jgi:uncharacterized Zn finger protein
MTTITVPKSTTRLQRGVRLFRERGHEIERIGINTYRAPSCTGEDSYLVFTDMGCCTCPDHRRAKAAGEACKHRVAVGIFTAKRRSARRRDAAG